MLRLGLLLLLLLWRRRGWWLVLQIERRRGAEARSVHRRLLQYFLRTTHVFGPQRGRRCGAESLLRLLWLVRRQLEWKFRRQQLLR